MKFLVANRKVGEELYYVKSCEWIQLTMMLAVVRKVWVLQRGCLADQIVMPMVTP